MTDKHTIRLEGPRTGSSRLPGSILHDLLGLLLDGCRGALRLRVDGRSTGPGEPPDWLERAGDFELVGLRKGSALVELAASPLGDAAPDLFRDRELFLSLDPRQSCLDLFEESFAAALSGDESDLYDPDLLRSFARFSQLWREGVDQLELCDNAGGIVGVRPDRLRRIEDLLAKLSPPRRVRLSGELEELDPSAGIFSLRLDCGASVRGIAGAEEVDLREDLRGKRVVVAGHAVFHPSGSVLRIETEQIAESQEEDSFYSKMPRPLLAKLSAFSRPQTADSGLNAIIGRWPGTESDDELIAALAEMS
jgi:hypothetical protein